MNLAAIRAESSIPYISHFEEMCTLVQRPVRTVESCAMSAVRASLDLNAAAIFVLSTSGESARMISKYRPVCPIIMITRNPSASRYGHLYRGVYPFLFAESKPDFSQVNWQEDVDRRIKWGLGRAMAINLLNQGEPVVVVQGWKVCSSLFAEGSSSGAKADEYVNAQGGMGNTNTFRIVKADVEHLGIGHE